MKKDSFKLIIMSVAVICIVIAGIMVPGIVLEANQKSEHDHVAKVPKIYLPSGSVMAKLYPVNLSPDYSNWYTWEAAAKKASDNTFNTYTAYYWIIRFEKYDGTQNHTIWMLEDGTIIMAKAHMKDISDMSEYKEVLQADGELQAENDLSAYKGYFDYSGIDFSKLNLISETTAVEQKNNESYEVLQFLQENEYVYAVHEK